MNELTLLEENQLYGDKTLELIKKRGTKAAITDFAILLGGYISSCYYVDGYNELDKRTGLYWTKTNCQYNNVHIVSNGGGEFSVSVDERYIGVRPVLPLSSIQSIPTNEIKSSNGILEVEYGYYPRSAVSKNMQNELETIYNKEGYKLHKTNKSFTTDSRRKEEKNKSFNPKIFYEFIYKGHKYVRVSSNTYDEECILSNGVKYKRGDAVWVEVEPVKWLVDEKSNLMISKELIVSGIQFKNTSDYKCDFSETDIKKFMNTFLIKELFQNEIINVKKK